jgi:hypothetical protein
MGRFLFEYLEFYNGNYLALLKKIAAKIINPNKQRGTAKLAASYLVICSFKK